MTKRKKILVKGPALSQTGYGEQTRFALRCLRSRPDLFEVYLINLEWGNSNHLIGDSKEKQWITKNIATTNYLLQSNQIKTGRFVFDMSLQVTIPNEFEKIAPVNVGYTAGIETTMVSPAWLEKCNETMDRLVVISDHSKEVFEDTVHNITDQTGAHNLGKLKLNIPCKSVNYSAKQRGSKDLGISFPSEFNYLVTSQWGPRKNFESTVAWFLEENYNKDVGLVLKTNFAKNCTMDRKHTISILNNMLTPFKGRKCSVTLLHGYMDESEMQSLYEHPQIKAFVNIAHGEGFGLPLFDAAAAGLPIITIGWSGQKDFLYKDGKEMFLPVDYTLKPVQQQAVWPGVIEKESKWAYANQSSYKRALREVRKNYTTYKEQALELKEWVNTKFTEENQYEQFVEGVWGSVPPDPQDVESEVVEYE